MTFDVNFSLDEENEPIFAEKYFFHFVFVEIILFEKIIFLGPHRHFEAYSELS